MKYSANRTIIALGCLLALLMAAIGPHQPGYTPPSTITSAATGIYWVEEASKDENRFVNQVDGYSITIPKQMNAVDMSIPAIRSVLEDEHRRVEIYKETTGPDLSAATYMEYSNRCLDNQVDHWQLRTEQLTLNGLSAQVTHGRGRNCRGSKMTAIITPASTSWGPTRYTPFSSSRTCPRSNAADTWT